MNKEPRIHYFHKGKDLLNSHIVKFEVQNGAWIGELVEENGSTFVHCKDYDGNLVHTIPCNENTSLGYIAKALAYSDERYEKIEKLKREVDDCNYNLFGETGIYKQMEQNGYSVDIIQNNCLVQNYLRKLDNAKQQIYALQEELEEENSIDLEER